MPKKETKLPHYYEAVGDKKISGLGIRHLQAGIMCLCILTLYVIRSSMGAAILEMTNTEREHIKGYDWDSSVQNIVLSSFFWGYMVMQIPASLFAKKFGGKPILLLSLIANGILCTLIPLFADFGWQWLCAVRIIMGLTQAALYPSCHTLLSKWILPSERTTIGNFVYAGAYIGTIVSLPLCGFLASTSLGWPLIFYVMGGLCFAMTIIWYLLSASYPSEHKLISENERHFIESALNTNNDQRNVTVPWNKIFRSRPVWALITAHSGFNWIFLIFFVEIPTFFKSILNFSSETSATLAALPFVMLYVMCLVFSYCCDYLMNKFDFSTTAARKIFNVIGGVGCSVSILAASFMGPSHSILSVAFITMAVGFYAAGQSSFMVNQMDLAPNYAGVLLAITNCVGNAVGAASPLVAAVILKDDPTDPTKWRMVFLIAIAVLCFACAIFCSFGSGELQPWNDEYSSNVIRSTQHEEPKLLESESLNLKGIDIRRRSRSNSILLR